MDAPRVLIIDDHRVVREGVRALLEDAPDACVVVGEAGTAAEARDLVGSLHPDVAIVDVVLPDGDGIQLCREIRSTSPDTVCLVLTSYPDRQAILSAAIAGAANYLPKDGTTDLVREVCDAARGEVRLDPDTVARLIEELLEEPREDGITDLTPQEHRVFVLIGQGMSNREIGAQLHLAEKTVKNYVSRLLDKLDMTRRTEAAILAARMAERRAQQRGRRER